MSLPLTAVDRGDYAEYKVLTTPQEAVPRPERLRFFCACRLEKAPCTGLLCREWANTTPVREICPPSSCGSDLLAPIN
jgi:hypothetical protein